VSVLVVFYLCNIETRGLLLGWSNYIMIHKSFAYSRKKYIYI
jgi:hypothetical protein